MLKKFSIFVANTDFQGTALEFNENGFLIKRSAITRFRGTFIARSKISVRHENAIQNYDTSFYQIFTKTNIYIYILDEIYKFRAEFFVKTKTTSLISLPD